MQHKVYVMLGFHINFYHSWRGDTPDEAGFGTDMRVIRGILDILDAANACGSRARGYWDTEVYWTFQEILPKHCPDILERMRRRVAAGLDEIVLGPFNNGANHAATEDEFRAAVAWSIENPWGSGLKQLFPRITPFYRPQESVFTTGQEKILKECRVEGLMLYYALVPFNTLGVFTPALPLERRYNPFRFRSREDQPPLVVFPAMSAADVMELTSLESMLLDLHDRQQRGEIQSDVVIHLNEDADLESWLPFNLPPFLKWFPNTGGLEEYIRLVEKYPWAEFTVPGEYLASHPPQGEVLVRQDLADGAFDGSYSWAEKCASLRTWTVLEQSRLASCRAEALAKRTGLDLGAQLWEGMQSSFFQRLIGLTTTHFGMSTPVINEERQARAFDILGRARDLACSAERQAAAALAAGRSQAASLYEFELVMTPPDRRREPQPARSAVCLPLILPAGIPAVRLERDGQAVPAGLTDLQPLPDGRSAANLRFTADLGPGSHPRFSVLPADPGPAAGPVTSLRNEWIEASFSDRTGFQSLHFGERIIGGEDFLQPFVSYRTRSRPVEFHASQWTLLNLPGERWEGLQRVRLQARLPMQTRHGEFVNEFTYTFTLFDDLPQLFVDVEARFAATPSTETIHNMIQKLRRLMDLRWVEVAPFQLHPRLQAPREKPLKIWKHNYLGLTAWYELNYGQINPRNRNLDSFNHQVTAGWVAVSDREHGLLLGENAEALASMAFCPMRLRERDGVQQLWLNPFGSYHGEQASYSHLGASGVGADFLKAFSGFLKPNGPSFNGQTLRFSLLLAPYRGDEPPADLQAGAAAHFYPPQVIFHASPPDVAALLPVDILQQIEDAKRQEAILATREVPAPGAFLANPSHARVDLVWDLPRDEPVTGLEVTWRTEEETRWQTERIPPGNRFQVTGLQDGQGYRFKLRAACGSLWSDWTQETACTPGEVLARGLGIRLTDLPIRSLSRILIGSAIAALRANLRRRK